MIRCRPATAAVRAGIDADTAFGAVTPPLVLSSNFSFAGFDEKRRYDYSRSGTPPATCWPGRWPNSKAAPAPWSPPPAWPPSRWRWRPCSSQATAWW